MQAEIELTQKQKKQLDGIKQWADVKSLQSRCDEFKEEFEQLQSERRKCLERREQLIKHLENDVQEKNTKAITDEETVRQKLELIKKSANKENNCTSFTMQNICLLLGYQISKCLLMLGQKDTQRTVGIHSTLRDLQTGCPVTFNELKELYEFVEEHTQHPEFAEIRKFLYNSQDLIGLLTCLKKLFDNKN